MNKPYIIIIIAALLAGFTACTSKEQPTETTTEANSNEAISLTPEQTALANIKVGTPTLQVVEKTIQCTGEVGVPPYSLASVYAPVAAFVKDVSLLEGEPITKGQVLVTLQHPDIIKMQQEYLSVQSKLAFLEGDFKRKETLVAQDATSQKNYEAARADYLTTKAEADGLAIRLNMIGIDVNALNNSSIQATVALRAPISGYLSQVKVNNGKYVRADEILFEIVDATHLHVEAHVFQQDAALVREGQPLRFKASGMEEWYNGEVHLINRKFDMESKTVNIHGHPDGKSPGLIPGAYLGVEIVVMADTGLAIPAEAVFEEGGQLYVFTQGENKTYKKHAISAGVHNNLWYHVDSSLANQQVVLSGGYYLKGLTGGEE